MLGWKGNLISSWSYEEAAERYGAPFWDFHRANLHQCLMDRVIELGGSIVCDSAVETVICNEATNQSTAMLRSGEQYTGDLIVGADGINTKLRGILSGNDEPPTPTGDLAYRLLLDTKIMLDDPELAIYVHKPQVNTWIGPDAHVSKLFQNQFKTQMT